MKKTIFIRSLILCISCIFLIGLFSLYFIQRTQDNVYHTTIESFLKTVSNTYEFKDYNSDVKRLKEVSTDNYKITLLNSKGLVLADSDGQNLNENLRDRKEIVKAMKTGEGYSIRYSNTVHKKVMYGAKVLENGNILRAMVPMSMIYSGLIKEILVIIFVAILSIIIAVIVSNNIANDSIAPLGAALDTYKREFFANASHELKTPITTIRGFSELISSGIVKDEDKIISYSNTIKKEAIRMDNLVEDILQLSDLEEKGNKDIPLENINIKDIIEETIEILDYKIYEKNIEINTQIFDDTIKSNHEDLLRIFKNLIENSIKYNRDNGRINIVMKATNNKVSIRISDTGIGIGKEDILHIFERFYRVDKSRNNTIEGTGLGLSIVKRLIHKYRGEIFVTSTIDVGTTFTVVFPK